MRIGHIKRGYSSKIHILQSAKHKYPLKFFNRMAKQQVSRDTPLAELTLRRYERPFDLKKRELVKKLCLSLGLLNPGDSRDVIVDVLVVILESRKTGQPLTSGEITEKVVQSRKQEKLKLLGIAHSNIRRQISRLRKLYLVEKSKNRYRIAENGMLLEAFAEKVQDFVLPAIVNRVRDYLRQVDDEFS